MQRFTLRVLAASSACALIAAATSTAAFAQAEQQPAAEQPAPGAATAASEDSGTMERADQDMRAVLAKLKELGAKPLEQLSVEEARAQPTPADAVKAVLEEQGKSSAPEQVANVDDIAIPGPAGDIPARVYTPSGEGPFPVVVYYHGGGWVIADLDTYDATPRAIANAAGAIVVSSHYRQAPEHKFPAAHEDAVAAYKWVVENAGQFNGDVDRLAVMGESAGGNLAANVAIAARDQALTMPDAQILVYPVAGTDMETPSYKENEKAMPLSKGGMMWFVDKVLATPEDKSDPRLNLYADAELAGLPPATIVTAEIDPLRSDGEMLAEKLQAAGVESTLRNFDGVTHEFFGMGAVVADAKAAQQFVGEELKAAFGAD